MFEGISSPSQAMLWLAVIEAAGFTAFTALAVVPLVRLLRDEREIYFRLHKDQLDVLIRMLAKDGTGKAAEVADENHAASRSPDANRPLPGRDG